MKYLLILLVSIFCCTSLLYSDVLNFESTAEGITKALTTPSVFKKEPKTRSLVNSSIKKIRGLTIVTKNNMIEKKEIHFVENKNQKKVNLKILFDVNSSIIREESFYLLNELGQALITDDLMGKQIILKGHTDSDGEEDKNLELSLNRAISVKNYLALKFQPQLNLKVIGFGEALPIVANDTEENKQFNRRVEISVDG